MDFVASLALKLPRMYMDFLKNNCSPLSKIASEQALFDLKAMRTFLNKLPTNLNTLRDEVREKYEHYFSRTGKFVLERHISIVSESITNLIGVIRVAASNKSFRYALMEHFPKSRYILDEEEDDEKISRRQRRRDMIRLHNTADLILQLMHVPDRKRKHELVDCGLIDGHSEDMLGEISITVSGEIFFVKVDVAGYQFNILKREEEFLSLVRAAKDLQQSREDAEEALDVPDPSSFFYTFNMLKTREEKLAPEFEELVQSMVTFATKTSYTFKSLDEFLETESASFRAHLVINDLNDDDRMSDIVTVRSTLSLL